MNASDLSASSFPKGFTWGASTSSFQIEGATGEDGRGASIWDVWGRMKDRIERGDTGDVACDHYHRWPEDVALMRELGLKAYRFSVAWPRILPRGKGAANEAGLAFYDRLIDGLLEAGIEPWLCLYHWDLPQALNDLGGWTNRDGAGWFADYATLCARRFGDRVKHWATFNEFSVFTLFGYGFGWFAPGVHDRQAHLRAIHHVNLAHGAAVDVIRAHVPGAWIGAVHSVQECRPDTPSDADRHATRLFDEHWNRAFPEPQILGHYPDAIATSIEPYVQAGDMAAIARPLDWFGLNHYSPLYCKADPGMLWGFGFGAGPEAMARTNIGWPIDPASFRDTLVDLNARYHLPIVVTENGLGTRAPETPDADGRVDDQDRIAFFDAYIGAVAEAIAQGADVRGYFAWSLLDNFEWGSGYAVRFGMARVDYDTLARAPKNSARWYSELIARMTRG